MWNKPLLPQNDSNAEKRQEEIRKEQDIYKYKYTYQSLETVAMADGVPHQELPKLKWVLKLAEVIEKLIKNLLENKFIGEEHKLFEKENKLISELEIFKDFLLNIKSDIGDEHIEKLLQLTKHFGIQNKSKHANSLEEYDEYFKAFPIPPISKQFQKDASFVARRVAGQNPVMLKSITDITKHFPLSDKIFNSISGFENDNLALAGEENRLYIIDYKALDGITNGKNDIGQKYSYAPKALFALLKDSKDITTALKPIAIICGQTADDKNPIFTPDDKYAWEIAKTIVEIADLNYHELVTHLGGTHLVIEPFVVTTHRQLAQRHPVKMLLLPHFEGTILINWGAQASLVDDGGSFDTLFSGQMDTNRAVVASRLGESFNKAMLPNDLKQRGVENEKLFYPYRDDATKIWTATKQWVGDYLSTYYKSDADIVNDTELQLWAKELISAGKVQGFGEDDKGKMSTFDYLKDVLTMLIFTASAQHAAVNFTQKDFSGYIPNMPAAGYTPAPTNKDKTEQDWFNLLPPVDMADSQVNLMQLLSGVNYTTLGEYGWSYFGDIKLIEPLSKFKSRLKKIEAEITDRNNSVGEERVYKYLLPSKIPQSINI